MEVFELEDPQCEYLLEMPEEVLPPESAYRFKPARTRTLTLVQGDVFSGTDRLIFGGAVQYSNEEIVGLQSFYRFIKSKKYSLPKYAY